MGLREDADRIVRESIRRVLPDEAVSRALAGKDFGNGRVYVVAAGKAAWQMANTAAEILGDRMEAGVAVTKYDHVKGDIPGMKCFEAGHPVPDANSFAGTQAALELVENLREEDTVLFLLSGGGSALFEKPLIPEEELADITKQLLACGADIVEINTIRKRISAVKGGKFAKLCEPARVFGIVLSDILGDPLDMIASGPAYPDSTTCAQAAAIAEKYQLKLSEKARELLGQETPKTLRNVETVITGSVRNLCRAAADACRELGYEPVVLTDQLSCEAREAGAFLAAIAKSHQESEKSLAFLAGGETVVHLTGTGMGGRNQELALAAAQGIAGLSDTAVFSVGSDGTDGPTDAAGGYCDGTTKEALQKQGIDIYQVLRQNDAYHALEKSGGLIITGATGTNVNDVAVVLIKR
ncbi:MAG: glycerate kinase [Ruminococcus sp.]|uniref:Glycerate kinase n=1 Tax=Schaedlerella arabinosiphila TaxID=2044587 RepID=A0A426DD72_9FIRM|nr:glycerate kinase [Schaedlerella arabinosiphila]MCI8723449.1 glycerate kinase [Ruminococcus sp.]MCI9211978.1 glycerate kinase [Ruminococcus sp.]RRK30756.1 glycerate kinase [Schaedlerella arabinosiphila]